MALPFYNQGDQDIYASGDRFIPQEQYRLNYTPSTQLANTIGNTGGVTSTGAAIPYIFPPQGGGGGGGAGDISGTQITYGKPLGLSPGALGGKLPGVGNWAKRTFGELEDLYSSLPLPSNLLRKGIMKWRENREIKKQEKAAADQAAADQVAADQIRANQVQQNIQIYGDRDRPDTGMNAPGGGKGQSPTGGNVEGTPFAHGGRIGMAKGKMPIPKAKKSGSFPWETSLIGLASLFNRRPLMLGKIKGINPGEYGTRQWRANKMKNLARMGGKWAGRTRFAAPALMNPWLMAPAALGLGAKYAVSKAFDPYRDETGKIGAEGHAQLASAARAREALMAQRNTARQNRRDGGLAEIL